VFQAGECCNLLDGGACAERCVWSVAEFVAENLHQILSMQTPPDGLSNAIYIFSEVPGFAGAVSYNRLAFVLGSFS